MYLRQPQDKKQYRFETFLNKIYWSSVLLHISIYMGITCQTNGYTNYLKTLGEVLAYQNTYRLQKPVISKKKQTKTRKQPKKKIQNLKTSLRPL